MGREKGYGDKNETATRRGEGRRWQGGKKEGQYTVREVGEGGSDGRREEGEMEMVEEKKLNI